MKKILTTEQMRQSDRNTISNGVSAEDLMYRAGCAVLRKAIEKYPVSQSTKIAVVSGKGGNGGDGFVIASELHRNGFHVTLYVLDNNPTGAANLYFERCKGDGVRIVDFSRDDTFRDYHMVFDAVFGTGFRGDPKGLYARAIQRINESGAFVVSVDINSGLGGDNGIASRESCEEPRQYTFPGLKNNGAASRESCEGNSFETDCASGIHCADPSGRTQQNSEHSRHNPASLTKPCAVKSNLTVCIQAPQPGLFLNDAKDYIKRIDTVDIGIAEADSNTFLFEDCDAATLFPERLNNSNKADYGYICLIAGCSRYSGAARLSAMAACRTGAGVVNVVVPCCISPQTASGICEATISPLSDNGSSLVFKENEFNDILSKYRTIGFGMGLSNTEETQKALAYLLERHSGTLVIDADGLNALSSLGAETLNNASCRVVLTPHIGEFSMLSRLSKEDIVKNPVNAAVNFIKRLSTRTEIVLLLKGPSTIVTNGAVTYITNRGCAGMATAGSGDVLSGVITAMLGYADCPQVFTVAAAAHLSGIAGELAEASIGQYSMLSGDTAAHIPEAIKSLQK